MVNVPRPTRWFSKRQEQQVAKNLGGKVNLNSGAAPFCAGDVVKDDFLIECKTVTKSSSSFSIKKAMLKKVEQEAFEMGKDNFALAFNFGPDEKCYYVITEKTMQNLIQILRN